MTEIHSVRMPLGRPFSWRALWILVLLQFLGNVAAIPLLRATDAPADSPAAWALWTALSVVMIGLAIFLAGRIGLGAPLVEGWLPRDAVWPWVRRICGLAIILSVCMSPLVLLVNLNVNPDNYPSLWKLTLSSVDAGVQEELFSRFFLMTGLAWLGSLRWREPDGRPAVGVIWAANIVSALLFGWAHIDQQLASPNTVALASIMIVTALFGLAFGWLYWKQGIESAILAHFLVDVVDSAVVIPAYLSGNVWVQIATVVGLALAGAGGWWLVRSGGARKE